MEAFLLADKCQDERKSVMNDRKAVGREEKIKQDTSWRRQKLMWDDGAAAGWVEQAQGR